MWGARRDVGLFLFLAGEFDAPVAGGVRLEPCVVQDVSEGAGVGLDRGGGEPLLDQGVDEVAAVPPAKRGGVSVSDRFGEGPPRGFGRCAWWTVRGCASRRSTAGAASSMTRRAGWWRG